MPFRGVLSSHHRAAILILLASSTLLVFDVRSASADRPIPDLGGSSLGKPALAPALLGVVCPGQAIRAADLDAARRVNNRTAIEAAIREAKPPEETPLGEETAGDVHFEDAVHGESPRWHGPRDPERIAGLLRTRYGPGSLVARGASGFAALAGAAEKTAQVPLDRANVVTDAIVDAGRHIPGLRNIPDFRLRSRVMSDEATVTLSTRW